MSRFFDLVSKPARDMGGLLAGCPQPHAFGDQSPRLISLDSNENPYGPSPRAIEAMQSRSLASDFILSGRRLHA